MIRSPTRKMLTPVAAARMLQAMGIRPQSLDDLVSVSGLAKQVVTRYVKALQCAGMLHVGGWARDARDYPTIRQFASGNMPDVACPKTTRTAAQRMRALRLAQKANTQ